MSFLLVYNFIWGEIVLIILGIFYILFHTGHGLVRKIWDIREITMFQKKQRTKILRKHTIEQKKVDSQTRRVDISLNGVKRHLSAKEKITLANICKNVQARLAVQEYEEARAHIIEGLIIDRHNLELNTFLAQLYEKEGENEKGAIIYRDLILHHDPRKADLYIYLGNNLLAQEKRQLAYDVFKKGLEKEPRNVQLLETMAELGYELHEYEEALLYSRKLAEVNPKHARAHEILGLSHLQVGSDQKAYDVFLTLRKIDPYNETVLVWLPKVEEKLGIHPDAKRLADRN